MEGWEVLVVVVVVVVVKEDLEQNTLFNGAKVKKKNVKRIVMVLDTCDSERL